MSSTLSQAAIDELLSQRQDTPPQLPPFSSMETDAVGEIMNISMGAAATALSSMLNKQVLITTPRVQVLRVEDFLCESMVPAVGVEIRYTEGLAGSNIFIMKQGDIKVIVDILMGGDGTNVAGEFNEMHASAICEVMNQMMGSASTALASFFRRSINISPPTSYPIEANASVGGPFSEETIVEIRFKLTVGDLIDSEMVSTMPISFAKELAGLALGFATEEEPAPPPRPAHREPPTREQERTAPAAGSAQPVAPQAAPPPAPAPGMVYANPAKAPLASVHAINFSSFDEDEGSLNLPNAPANLNMILDVPLEISVEIGRTKRPVREILEFSQGSIIELEKLAGDPVDITVNGQLIAKGDVVVIDDNFGVRITEIIPQRDRIRKIKK